MLGLAEKLTTASRLMIHCLGWTAGIRACSTKFKEMAVSLHSKTKDVARNESPIEAN